MDAWQFNSSSVDRHLGYFHLGANTNKMGPSQVALVGKEPTCQSRRHRTPGFDLWVRKIPWRRAWQPTPGFLPGESHGQRSMAGCSPQGQKESDMLVTEKQQQIKYLWPVIYVFLYRHMLFYKYLGIESLDHMLVVGLTFFKWDKTDI